MWAQRIFGRRKAKLSMETCWKIMGHPERDQANSTQHTITPTPGHIHQLPPRLDSRTLSESAPRPRQETAHAGGRCVSNTFRLHVRHTTRCNRARRLDRSISVRGSLDAVSQRKIGMKPARTVRAMAQCFQKKKINTTRSVFVNLCFVPCVSASETCIKPTPELSVAPFRDQV